MVDEANQVKCPVCRMIVPPGTREVDFQQMRFAFCSDQCRTRFLANPHLYIGFPGQQAPKQMGDEVIKRRCFKLSQRVSNESAEALARALHAMMGIRSARIEGAVVEVTYDLLEVTARQIETTIVGVGLKLGGGWAERLRRACVHESEAAQVSSLEATPGRHRH